MKESVVLQFYLEAIDCGLGIDTWVMQLPATDFQPLFSLQYFLFTSAHSVEPNNPNSSASQLAKIIVRLGLQPAITELNLRIQLKVRKSSERS